MGKTQVVMKAEKKEKVKREKKVRKEVMQNHKSHVGMNVDLVIVLMNVKNVLMRMKTLNAPFVARLVKQLVNNVFLI